MKAARLAIAVGVLLFWALVVLLDDYAGFTLVDSILLSVLLVVIPAFSLAQVPMIEGAEIEREPAYWSSIAALWLVGTACWLVGTRNIGAAGVGVVSLSVPALVGWSVGATGAALLLMFGFRAASERLGIADTRILAELLPRTRRERRIFALLSLAAGTGEELAYRGYSITMLAPVTGLGNAVIGTTLVFGIMHAYQGWFGVVRTTAMGAILAGTFVLSGSLWPCMIAHTAIDLLAGLVLGDRLLTRDD